MIPQVTITDRSVTQIIDAVGPSVKERLVQKLGPIGAAIAADANSRTAAHIRFIGAKNPGTLATSFKGGVSTKSKTRITGWARSGHPLAHLMENGFQITDIMISAKAADVMAFAGDAGEVFRKVIHRHATKVPAYPALGPAFEARKGEIMAALQEIAARAG